MILFAEECYQLLFHFRYQNGINSWYSDYYTLKSSVASGYFYLAITIHARKLLAGQAGHVDHGAFFLGR
jgi:hypothetical protein